MGDSISVPEIIAGVISGGGLTQVANFFMRRKNAHAYAQGAVDRAMKSRDEALARADARAAKLEERMDQAENQHEQCEKELRNVNLRCDEALQEIERLMAGPVASYGGPTP